MHDIPLIQTQSILLDRAVVNHIVIYDQLTDRDLVGLSLRGDQHAYEHLIDKYHYQLMVYLKRLLNYNTEDAADVENETWVKIYQNLSRFNIQKSFSGWIYRIAHNTSIDLMRRNQRNSVKYISNVREAHFATHMDTETPSHDELVAVLNQLKPPDRNLLILRYIEEKSISEMSALLAIPASLVSVKLFRAAVRARKIASKLRHSVV